MGTTLNSIHIYADFLPADMERSFRSFSPGWFTCLDDLSDPPERACQEARRISKEVPAPVLLFGVYDSDMIWFTFYRNGKVAAKYSDDGLTGNKNLYGIPALIGYGDGFRQRLSGILACSDVERKITMLEEYFGVRLLFCPELSEEHDLPCCTRGDAAYRAYQAEERALTGKAAPMAIRKIAEYHGKLFEHVFGTHGTYAPHIYLYGYAQPFTKALTTVEFLGDRLEPCDPEKFEQGQLPVVTSDPRFPISYDRPGWFPAKVTFSPECPPGYCGKTMVLPNGCWPLEFLPTGELLLEGNQRIFVADETLRIIAKLPIRGDIAEVLGNHVLTVTGDSFCGYCYEPQAKIRIYEITSKAAI